MSAASSPLPPIAFLGAGAMGGAIIRGLAVAGDAGFVGGLEHAIRAVNRTESKAAELRELGVTSLAYDTRDDATPTALAGAKLVVLGVKPAGIPGILEEIRDWLEPDAVIVSIAAGVTVATMEALVPHAVVRTMPNTPSLVRRGVTGIAPGGRASTEEVALVSRVFEAVGEVLVLPESQIDALSAISGSGPAYVYFLIEQLTVAARQLGFEDAAARRLAEGTFVGAGALLEAGGEDPAELRRRVTSPKGTTERAIAVLEDADLAGLFARAAAAAIARARELAAGG
ncbi:MAG TPA: pyrroline-5-carboxylate reductase [Microbacteriaceae bacterium]|nr:pyrroline-5-carboxylate reductase [Microbacteriaceae bacterium]